MTVTPSIAVREIRHGSRDSRAASIVAFVMCVILGLMVLTRDSGLDMRQGFDKGQIESKTALEDGC